MSTYNPFKNVKRPLQPPQRKDISSAETTANKSTTQHRTTKGAGEEEQHTNKRHRSETIFQSKIQKQLHTSDATTTETTPLL
jgi:hypothetical protein